MEKVIKSTGISVDAEKQLELVKTVFKLFSLPNANEAVDDVLDEVKHILGYHEKAAFFPPPKEPSPAVTVENPIRFINKMHITSKPNPLLYDPRE